ncbi:MAG: glycoside hydrolase family 97 N-terminal domain-containing protein, partial [Terriglobia bacterium]
MSAIKLKTITFLGFIVAIRLAPCAFAFQAVTATSPDGNLSISFQVKANSSPYQAGARPYYSVHYKNAEVLADSPLGLKFLGMAPLETNLAITGSSMSTHDDFWQNPFGQRHNIRDHYNQLTVPLVETKAPHRRVKLVFRAYNDGVAFRYVLPQQPAIQKFTLSSES